MEAAKVWSAATLACMLVLCITSTSVTWHCVSEVARLQSRVERLEAEDKGSSVSQILSQLGMQTPVYQGDDAEEGIPGHQRMVRQDNQFRELVLGIVRAELEAHLDCSTIEETKCTIDPGPKGDTGPPGSPGPQGEKGDEGGKGDQGGQGQQGYPGFKGEKGEQGLQGGRGERGEKGDMGTRGLVGEKGERGDTGPVGPVGAKGEKGHVGFTGFKGQKGEVGDQGVQGPIGERGKKGDMGDQGPVGEKGERGDTGTGGAKGEKGQPGYPGYKGQKGEVGEEGVQGPKGAKGAQSERGPKGEKGDSDNHSGHYTCGDTTGWARVAYLDMTDSSHQCPGDMVEFSVSGKRLCGRTASASRQTCFSSTFSTNGLQYSQVCGRITGYQYGAPDGFYLNSGQTIESYYVDGVSVTHGPPGSREHVWTFVTGGSESGGITYNNCPCAPGAQSGERVPSFLGLNYFCESGYGNGIPPPYTLNSDDPLWDGDGCSVAGNTCCEFNNPPYFTRHLTNPTSNDLEVRACGAGNRDINSEDTLIEVIELYVKQ